MAAPRHPVRVGPRFPVRVNMADTIASAPDGAILHFDPTQGLTEQTGNHPYLSSILGPQYVRQADGTSVDIGAAAPVDTFENGLVGLRSVGQVTNIDATLASYTKFNCTVSGIRITSTNNDFCRVVRLITVVAGQTYTISRRVAKRVGHILVSYYDVADRHNIISTMDGSVSRNDAGVVRVVDGGSYLDIHVTITVAVTSVKLMIGPASLGSFMSSIGDYVDVLLMWTSATAYPVPYVPPGITQPASNATATGGSWFSIPVGSPVWNALSGGPMTLASAVRMGVGSSDLLNNTTINLLACDDAVTNFLRFAKDGGGATYLQLHDGTNTAQVACTVSRYGRIQVAVQALANGTQMRIGYRNLTAGQTAITWGVAATYRGTFGPDATLQRLMAGYENAYPLWVEKLTTIPEAISDARILEAAV